MIGTLSNDTEAYGKARRDLLEAEAALRDQREKVAELRRALPEGTPVEDYPFETGPADLGRDGPIEIKPLSALFTAPDRTLVIYHFMLGAAQENACAMCTMWIDGWNAVAPHVEQNVDLVIASRAPLTELRALARERGWSNLRLVSTSPSTMTRDFGVEDDKGSLMPVVNVFKLDGGKPIRTYTGSAIMDDLGFRGLDLLSPVWNILDLTPDGRGEWWPRLTYEAPREAEVA